MVPLLLLLPLLWGGSLTVRRDYELELEVQESVTVQEGLCVHVPCSFYPWNSWYPSSKLYTYWYRRRDTINWDVVVATNNPSEQLDGDTQRRFLLADPRTNNCSLSIRDARKSDAGTYFFRVERYNAVYDYQDKMLTLRVTEFTQKPDILIAEALESGRPTQLTCSLPGSCKGGTPLTFSWAGAALDSLNSRNLRSSVLTFTPRPRDHGTNLTCQVKPQWRLVTTQRTILLNVFYAPRKLTIDGSYRNVTALKILQSTSSLPILEGEALRLLCVADSNPPAQLSWFRGSPALNATPISSTAILELPRMGTGEEGEFTCQARHPLGSQNLSFSLAVVYPPRLLGPSCSWEDEGLRCSCSSRAQPAPSLRWRLGEELLEGNHSNASYTVTSSSAGPWANSSLSLRVGLAGLTLSCEAENVHGAQSASVLLLLPGQSASASREVPVALAGAGAMALLSLCLCLISFCMVKFCRKQAGRRRRVTNDEDPVMGTVPWGSQQKSQPARPPDQASPTRDIPPSGEQQELHYANISFHGLKPREPQDQEATRTSEYSEIKMTSK